MQEQIQGTAVQAVSLLPYYTLPRVDETDPNNWLLEPDEPFYIYGDDMAQIAVTVDYDDYLHFSRWRWKPKRSKRSKNIYLQRCPSEWSNGVRLGSKHFYLHIEILKRAGILRPTIFHTIVDHRDRDPMNCRRRNLRWVTFKENMANRVLYRGPATPLVPGQQPCLGGALAS